MSPIDSKIDLSVVLCTWNNSGRLAITLDSLTQCVIPPELEWEVVLVNNNCADDTDYVVRKFAERLPLVYRKEPRQGVSRARNMGVKAASGELIVFTDDDVKPCPEWIATYWSGYRERPTGYYFGGPIQSEFETPNPDAQLLCLAPASVRGLEYGQQSRNLTKHEYFIGPNWACPAEAVRAIGGFDINKSLDPSLGKFRVGGETDFMRRLKKRGLAAWYLPGALVVHFVPAHKCTLKHVAARAEAHGVDQASHHFDGKQVPTICRIPRWMYRQVLVLWARWIWARARGKKGYQEYVRLQLMIGTMKGVREIGRAVGDATH